MHQPRWGLFYDVHTMPACPDVGAGFDPEAFTARIAACGVDWLVFHARCNLGMAYYDTRVGLRHPSLEYDLFGRLAEACRRRGLALSAYFNVGLSHEEALRNRAWTVLTPEGYTYLPDRMDHFMRMMCYNTGYAEHLLEMIREVVSGYSVAGIFLDCFRQHPCVGGECVREMKERGLDWTDPRALHEFARFSRLRLARRITDTARAIRPDLLLYYNGLTYEEQEELGNYLEFECLPTGGWGYELLPLYGRYLRTLGKPVLNMTGRFHRSWGDFGGIRTEAGLEYDCLHGLALGMRPTVGDHFHPRGDLNRAVFDLIERVYTRLQRLEPWLEAAQPAAEVAVVAPAESFSPVPGEGEAAQAALQGAVRMLAELQQQFDVVSYHRSWEGYRLLVLPDLVTLDEAAAARLREHLAAGGAVLASAWSGADPERQGFVLPDWGAELRGESPHDPAYLLAGESLAPDLPAMPLVLYDRGTALRAQPGAEVLAEIIAPYYNRRWDGEHHFVYLPPDRPTGEPAITLAGPVAHLAHPLFTSYFNHAPVPLRQIVGHLLERLLPQPLLRVEGLPSFGRALVTTQPGRRLAHLLAYVPERRGAEVGMIEEPIEVGEMRVALRADGPPVRRVYLAPGAEELAWEESGGYLRAVLPRMQGHALVVFEEGE